MATHFSLNTGARIPSVGLGTYKAGPGVVADTVAAAVKIGVALKKLLVEGVVKREELFITSKIWCSDLAPEDVPPAIDSTLKDLQLDYVDLYLVHWPFQLKKVKSVLTILSSLIYPRPGKQWSSSMIQAKLVPVE